MKVSRKLHIRKTGVGKGKIRRNPRPRARHYPKPLGLKITLKPGKYELIGYDEDSGPYHSDKTHILNKPTDGLVIQDVWEGLWTYNILIYDFEGNPLIVNASEKEMR